MCIVFRISVEGSSGRSTRRRVQALEISSTSLRTIMKNHLLFHPYKITILHNILLHGPVQRLQLSNHMLNILQDDLALIITSDEAHFLLNGHANKQSCRNRVKEDPREQHRKPLQRQKKKSYVVMYFANGWDNWALFL